MRPYLSAALLCAAGCCAFAFAANVPPTSADAAAPAPAAAPAAPSAGLAPLFHAQVPAADATVPPANTIVELELVDSVGSESSKKGDTFKLRVVQPVVVEGKELVPAGTIAVGQVVHAAKAGIGGKGGELILAARYLEMPNGPLKLRSSLGVAGQGHAVASFVVAQFIGPLALAVYGNRIQLPPGHRFSARIAPTVPAPAPAPATEATAATPTPVPDAAPDPAAAPAAAPASP